MRRLSRSRGLMRLGIVPVLALIGLSSAVPVYAQGGWTSTGSTSVGHAEVTAVRLLDGRVLVAGGQTAASEVYDPQSGVWSRVGDLPKALLAAPAILLPDGRVLIAGGMEEAPGGYWVATARTEVFDPTTNGWTSVQSMSRERVYAAMVLLQDGRALVVGGATREGLTYPDAEIYDSESDTWTPTANAPAGSWFYESTATLLPDGRVLVAGSPPSPTSRSASIYDPVSDSWTLTANMVAPFRQGANAVLLTDGTVLLIGGLNTTGQPSLSAEFYDPTTNIWRATGSMQQMHPGGSATLLTDGRVLVAGGGYCDGDSACIFFTVVEVYDPVSRTWSVTSSMAHPRYYHGAALLLDGSVLVAGGYGPGPTPASTILETSAELYQPVGSSIAKLSGARGVSAPEVAVAFGRPEPRFRGGLGEPPHPLKSFA